MRFILILFIATTLWGGHNGFSVNSGITGYRGTLFSESNLMVSRTFGNFGGFEILTGIGFAGSHDFYQEKLGMVEAKVVLGVYRDLGERELIIFGELGASEISVLDETDGDVENNVNIGGVVRWGWDLGDGITFFMSGRLGYADLSKKEVLLDQGSGLYFGGFAGIYLRF